MIRSIEILDARWRKRIGRERLELAPGLNVLCGPNGSGKSSVIGALSEETGGRPPKGDPAIRVDADRTAIYYHDAGGKAAPAQRIESSFDVLTARLSRGERLRVYLRKLDTMDEESAVLVMDEPETALDLEERLAFVERLAAVTQRHQALVATHCPLLIGAPQANLIVMGADQDYPAKLLERWRSAICRG